MKKVTIIRSIILSTIILSLGTMIAVEVMYNSPMLNLLTTCAIFIVYTLIGTCVSDYINKHDIWKVVLGEKLSDMFNM